MMSTDEESSYSTISTTVKSEVQKPKPLIPHGRKSKETTKLLISLYSRYEGHWDEKNL